MRYAGRMRFVVVGLLAACGSVSSKMPDASVGHDSSGNGDAAHDAAPDSPPTCAPKPSSLAARWRAEQNPNDSENNFVGTPVGNVTYAAGKHGSAFLFDGASYIHVDDGDALWPPASFSIELWVNTTHSGTSMNLVDKYECWNSCPPGTTNAYWGLFVTGAGNPELDLRPDASTSYSVLTDSLHTVNDGRWHHLVGLRDTTASKIDLYVDGAFAVEGNLDQTHNGPLTNNDNEIDPIVIAGTGNAGAATYTATFTGAIDEVAFYAAALTPQEIAALYSAPDGECP